MAKNLSRRPGATDNAGVMQQILSGAELAVLPLAQIQVVPGFNPRTRHMPAAQREEIFSAEALAGLTSSMAEQVGGKPRGVLQPLLVRPATGGYQLIAGERRYHAARYAGLTEVPALIKDMDDEAARHAAIIENAQRRGLDPISETREGFAMLEQLTGLETEAVLSLLENVRKGRAADELGLDATLRALYDEGVATWSQTRAAVLRLTPAEQQAILDGHLNYRHAARLTAIKDHSVRAAILREVLNSGSQPTARELQTIIDLHAPPRPTRTDRASVLRNLAGRIKGLEGPQAERADALIAELQKLLD